MNMAGIGGMENVLAAWDSSVPDHVSITWLLSKPRKTKEADFYDKLHGDKYYWLDPTMDIIERSRVTINIIDKVHPDVLIAPTGTYVGSHVSSVVIAKVARAIPTIIWLHGKPSLGTALSSAYMLKHADAIWGCGQTVIEDANHFAPNVPKLHITNPILNRCDKEAAIGDKREDHNEPTVLYCGRLDADQKGVDLLIEAMLKAKQKPRLAIIGGFTTESQEVRHRVMTLINELSKAASVLQADWSDNPWNLASALGVDWTIIPSIDEGEPLVARESLACGIPLIAIHGATEIALTGKENGIQFTTYAELTELLERVATNRLAKPKIQIQSDTMTPQHMWTECLESIRLLLADGLS